MHGPRPPSLPPKPGSHETSRINTSAASTSPRHGAHAGPFGDGAMDRRQAATEPADLECARPALIPDPGDQWLPDVLLCKSKQQLVDIATNPSILNALTHAPGVIHPSLLQSQEGLQTALAENLDDASRLVQLEGRLSHRRSTLQAQLLSTHALERQWRQRQSDMDQALAPFSPASLYQRLGQGVHEQASVCQALEESFIEGDGDGAIASERETLDWVKRYRDLKVLYYLRQERKERWDEARVGGWR